MNLLDVVTINSKGQYDGYIKILENAVSFFPSYARYEINPKGNIELTPDGEAIIRGRIHSYFLFKTVMRELRRYRRKHGIENPVFGVTQIVILDIYRRFERGRFKRGVDAVHDYVTDEVGFVSLWKSEYFRDENAPNMITAHAIGHNKGLKHHIAPDDFMYTWLTRLFEKNSLEENQPVPQRLSELCQKCKNILKKNKNV